MHRPKLQQLFIICNYQKVHLKKKKEVGGEFCFPTLRAWNLIRSQTFAYYIIQSIYTDPGQFDVFEMDWYINLYL